MNILRAIPGIGNDVPIITSLLDKDFYKETMKQFIFSGFADVIVTLEFKCRTNGARLTSVIPESELRQELDHVITLEFGNSELHYLRGTNEYGERMFREPYLKSLTKQKMPPYDLKYEGDDIHLSFTGRWGDVTDWETMALSIISELYYRSILREMSAFEREAVYAEGKKRLFEKIKILKKNPQIKFSDSGTRRRFSKVWHDLTVSVFAEELDPDQFRGTSNIYLAMKYGLMPMGTNAHELQMVLAGILGKTDDGLLGSQKVMLDSWWRLYGESLSIFLPDTFGTESFLRNLDPEMAFKWKGFRQDSGDPIWEGSLWLKYYKKHGIDHREKMMISSDGLNVEEMLRIYDYFKGLMKLSFGPGTNLTNDLGLPPISMVIKPVFANGIPLVKLSNNPKKAIGDKKEAKRYRRVFGYGKHREIECTY